MPDREDLIAEGAVLSSTAGRASVVKLPKIAEGFTVNMMDVKCTARKDVQVRWRAKRRRKA